MAASFYTGPERREFTRLDYVIPLGFKVCKQETLSKLLNGYTSDISRAGLLCNVREKVKEDDILWLSFDRSTLDFCQALEKRALIYQSGVIGKVVRVEPKDDSYHVGVRFITIEEKNSTHIYPKVHFLLKET
ncbi:MAG: PilZ domain-containing protein [Candidatus Omnitrophica bacterium]|nr:PilZ domain-containing protein [Candidatus Omnitrophota bacterium]